MPIARHARPRRHRSLIAGLALAVSAAVPAAAAAAPTISVDRACYVRTSAQAPRMRLTGSGFAPSGAVTVTDSSGTLDATTTADAAGVVSASFAGPSLVLKAPGQVRDVVTASESTATGAHLIARTTTDISILGAGHGPTGSARGLRALRERANWVFSGWTVGRPLYVHYLRAGRAVARADFGRPSAPCGVLRVRRALFPGTPKATSYRTQIDESPAFSPRTRPRFTLLRVGLQLEF